VLERSLVKPEWYGVKGLFRWAMKSDRTTRSVEERVLLFRTTNFDAAVELARHEAARYCTDDPKANFFIEPLDWWDVYLIGDEAIENGAEVYSRLSTTTLDGEAFIRRYYPKSHDHVAAR